MINSIQNVSFQSKYDKHEKAESRKDSFKALGIQIGASLVGGMPAAYAINKMSKLSMKLTPEQIKATNLAGEKMRRDLKLDKTGLKIMDYKNLTNITIIPDKVFELINPIFATSQGKNAFYAPKKMEGLNIDKNNIYLNKEKFSLAQFHELGHAVNNNFSKLWRGMQKVRTPLMITASTLPMFMAFTKNTTGEENSKFEKFKNKVRNNIGTISFVAMMGIFAEECKASLRAKKWVNANMTKDLAKKVNKSNMLGALSYLTVAAVTALAARYSIDYKDKKAAERENF
ncbi:MAG: hypothetical protein LKG27_07465 [Clostridiaceae bacterium]|nr:hypothetical protein [Clostridiaceae bacterium]